MAGRNVSHRLLQSVLVTTGAVAAGSGLSVVARGAVVVGDLDWLTDPPPEPGHAPAHPGPNAPAGYEAFTADVTHLLMGRGTYDKVATFDPCP